MPCRRTHPKSRHGCAQCKKRRVKCDEQRPRCLNCINRNQECRYASSGSLMWPATSEHQKSQTSSASETPASPFASSRGSEGSGTQQWTIPTTGSIDDFGRLINNGAVPPVPDVNLRDMELMLQWCTSTYSALSRDESTKDIWREFVPREAVSEPFLMHGVLALSALHLARLSSDARRSTYMGIAVGHQNKALALFRPVLGSIDASNCNATFALSSIVTVFAFGFPQSGPMDTLAAVDDLYQVFLLSRGMQQVLNASIAWISGGVLGPVVKLDDYNAGLPDDAKFAIQRLFELNDSLGASDPHHETDVYRAAISELEVVLDRIYGNPKKPNIAVLWAIKIPPRYLDLLREHRPMALAILAHYSVVLHHLRKHWWFEGWSVRVLGAIWSNMSAEWRSSINWAMEVARSDVSIVPPGQTT